MVTFWSFEFEIQKFCIYLSNNIIWVFTRHVSVRQQMLKFLNSTSFIGRSKEFKLKIFKKKKPKLPK